jgi:hypothetical protein
MVNRENTAEEISEEQAAEFQAAIDFQNRQAEPNADAVLVIDKDEDKNEDEINDSGQPRYSHDHENDVHSKPSYAQRDKKKPDNIGMDGKGEQAKEEQKKINKAEEDLEKFTKEIYTSYQGLFDEWEELKSSEKKPNDNKVVNLLNKIDKSLKDVLAKKDFITSKFTSENERANVFRLIEEHSTVANDGTKQNFSNIDTSINLLKQLIIDSDLTSINIKSLYEKEPSVDTPDTPSISEKINALIEQINNIDVPDHNLDENSFSRKTTDALLQKINSIDISDSDIDEALKNKLTLARTKLLELKISHVRKILPEVFLNAENIDGLTGNLIDLVTQDETLKEELKPMVKIILTMNAENLEVVNGLENKIKEAKSPGEREKLIQLKSIAWSLAESGINTFYKEGGASLKIFFEFLSNPSGGNYTENSQNGGSAETLTLTNFQEKMENIPLVVKSLNNSLSNCKNGFIKKWTNENFTQLNEINSNANIKETSRLLVSLYSEVLSSNPVAFDEFITEFSSSLGGKENLVASDDIKELFKNLLKDDGKLLKILWDVKDSSEEDKSDENRSTQDSNTTTDQNNEQGDNNPNN